MPALPSVSGADAVRALRALGFLPISQRGSHLKLRDTRGHTVIVPMHRELEHGTLRSILKQAGIQPAEFATFLRKG